MRWGGGAYRYSFFYWFRNKVYAAVYYHYYSTGVCLVIAGLA